MTYDLTIERLIDGPREEVFDAFVDPDAQKALYANDEEDEWHVESELDLRVGGTWTIVFGKAGEEPFRETNVFTEVDRPRRLAFASTMFKGKYGGSFDTTVTVTFEDR
ncbi:MAG TPA: SRPBCC domain-containing protein, partial [Actinomycetota bacterium]|nr:SRPBCC domain-containing protein [Actinomycetota bacterium]